MASCYNCNNEITGINASEEHIIINACGGQLMSKELLCSKCNAHFGKTFDAELARQTNDLSNLLQIKRHRGKPQPIKGRLKTTGEEYYLDTTGKPILTKPIIKEEAIGTGSNLSITARNQK